MSCPYCTTELHEYCGWCGYSAAPRRGPPYGFVWEDARARRWQAVRDDMAARGGYAPIDLENRE